MSMKERVKRYDKQKMEKKKADVCQEFGNVNSTTHIV